MPEYPGWGLPLRHEFESKGTYPSGPHTLHIDSHMISVREVAMMYIMDRFTDRNDWHKIIFDEEHLLQWRQDMLAIPDLELKNIVYAGKHDELINYEPAIETENSSENNSPWWHIKLTGIINDAALDFVSIKHIF